MNTATTTLGFVAPSHVDVTAFLLQAINDQDEDGWAELSEEVTGIYIIGSNEVPEIKDGYKLTKIKLDHPKDFELIEHLHDSIYEGDCKSDYELCDNITNIEEVQ